MANRLISHLAHVELLTPDIRDTSWFFQDLLGLYVVGRDNRSVYMRAWGEFHVPFSLKLTEAERPGLGHLAWRADSKNDLRESVRLAKSDGAGVGWGEKEPRHGPSYTFKTPEGHQNEIFWEMEEYSPPGRWRSSVKGRPMKIPNRSIAVNRLDHCTLFASSVEKVRRFYQRYGFKYNEGLVSSAQREEIRAFLTSSVLSHDLGILRDPTRAKGRLNHVAYRVENVGSWVGACDTLVESGVYIEMGPMRHGTTDSLGLYVIEPGGNRVELYSGGYLNFTPQAAWKPVVTDVDAEEGRQNIVWGLGLLAESWMSYGTPPVELSAEAKVALGKVGEARKADLRDAVLRQPFHRGRVRR